MIKWIAAALVLLVPSMLGVVFIQGTSAGGGSDSLTISDDFSTDTDAHYDAWTGMTSCIVTTTGEGIMSLTGQGLCHPKDGAATPPGTQPTSIDHWALFTYPNTVESNKKGPAVRVIATEPGGSDYNYTARCDSGAVVLQSCNTGDSCTTYHNSDISCGSRADDTYGLAVAGTGVGTELCLWMWNSAGPAYNEKPSDTWGNADFCSSADGTITNAKLTAISDCAGTTVCEDWDIEGTGPPTGGGGYADVGTDCAIYSGNETGFDVDAFSCGDL